MSADLLTIYRQVTEAIHSTVQAIGVFDAVLAHEPKSAPATDGLTVGMWAADLRPIQSSGLDAASARMEITVRIYANMLTEPQDLIDIQVLGATNAILGALSRDYTLTTADPTLAGIVRQIDLYGEHGDNMRTIMGYVDIGQAKYRIAEIFVPVIINDLYPY